MATVDGVVTAPSAQGIIQGNGGAEDRLAGGSGNDQLQGQAAFNQYYGGAGNDTFILSAKFAELAGAHQGQSLDFTDQFAYITDFQGAGVSGGDFIRFQGGLVGGTNVTWDASSLTLEHTGATSASGTLYYYSVADTAGHTFNFIINSVNHNALGAGDFNFY